jgi:serine/threonine protein phosphatase PrpC
MDPLADTAEYDFSSELDKLAAKHFGPGVPPTRVTFGALSHVGKVRTNNEDHFGVVQRHRSRDVLFTNLPKGFLPPSREEAYTMVVADGLGGAAFGELASMLALRTGWELTSNAYHWHFRAGEREAEEVMEQLKVYGKLIHEALLERSRRSPELAGMGSTITAVFLMGADAFIGHVGDSRAYLFRDGSLRQLTHDDTQAQHMVDIGVYASVDEAPRFMHNVLMNCLGGNDHDVQVETHHIPLVNGDRLLLCTDGLSDMLADAEIASILNQHPTPMDACQTLVNAALENGGKDNVTVVLACIEVEKNA